MLSSERRPLGYRRRLLGLGVIDPGSPRNCPANRPDQGVIGLVVARGQLVCVMEDCGKRVPPRTVARAPDDQGVTAGCLPTAPAGPDGVGCCLRGDGVFWECRPAQALRSAMHFVAQPPYARPDLCRGHGSHASRARYCSPPDRLPGTRNNSTTPRRPEKQTFIHGRLPTAVIDPTPPFATGCTEGRQGVRPRAVSLLPEASSEGMAWSSRSRYLDAQVAANAWQP